MGPGWNDPRRSPFPDNSPHVSHQSGPTEGKVEVTRFVAEGDGAAALGKGSISVGPAPTGAGVDDLELRVYEAAVVDQLAHLGYQTATTNEAAHQVTELRVTHTTVVPEEAPHKPVSGEMAVGASNYGSSVGMALNVDLSKPRAALISTRLEARIRDKASNAVLWEGRADVVTREGDAKWNDKAIASKLSIALFDRFPGRPGETVMVKR
jgi:hypothetical protein